MGDVAIKLPKAKVIEGLAGLSFKEIKEIIDSLIQKRLFKVKPAKGIYREVSAITKKKKLTIKVAEEAVKWSRARK